MKLWKRAGSLGLSLALCTGLVLPALAHTVTIDGEGSHQVGTVQEGVSAIEASASQSGTIKMDGDDNAGAVISKGNVTLDLEGHSITNNATNGAAITVSGGGKLTLQDSGTGGKVEATGMFGTGVEVNGGATANILGGEVKATGGEGTGVKAFGGGTANILGGEVKATGEDGTGVKVSGGTANILGGEVKATGEDGNGMYVSGGTANIWGGAVSGEDHGVDVNWGGTVNISGGTVSGDSGVSSFYGRVEVSGGVVSGENGNGVYVGGGSLEISGGTVSGGQNGVGVNGGGTANILGGEVKATGEDGNGVYVRDGEATISDDATVTGETGVQVEEDSTFTMNGGTVGSTVKDGAAVDGSGTITLKGGTIYGKVPDGVTIGDKVTVKDAPYVPPTPGPAPASDPLTRPAAARTLLEELFRRAGGSGELWTWAVENGLIDEDGDGDEIVTVALLRSILTRYAQAFGGSAVAVEDLTTLTGADADIVRNCRAVLKEFFGE